MYIHVQDGEIKKGPCALPRSWGRFSGFHFLSETVEGRAMLLSLGWLPVEKNEPAHDPELQYLVPSGFDIQADKAVWNFEARDREIAEVFDADRFDAWYPVAEVEGGIILREAQAVYRTKQDVLNDLALRPAEAKAYLQILLNECMHWVETHKLDYLDPGLYDETHQIKRIKNGEEEWRKADGFWMKGLKQLISWFGADGGDVERYQYELQENSDARLFRLGFAREEAQELMV
ncbi:MAG: hypothetical protein SV487_08070 [Thermodesulfobacteriota bacterium]|nr:hypothetical protein [Thermodesulfobacteriota bacterium]